MTRLPLTAVACATPVMRGGHYSNRRLDLGHFGTLGFPVMAFDHYQMRGRTFSAHPHAGISIIAYVFEDSPGSLRSRDSLHNDQIIKPGSLLWTQASTGIVHEEFPALQGEAVHGLQLLINPSKQNKALEPCTCAVNNPDIPQLIDLNGTRVRVLCGQYLETKSPVVQAERFDFIEARITTTWCYTAPPDRNFMMYVLSGDLKVTSGETVRHLKPYQALAGQTTVEETTLRLEALEPCHVLVLCGKDHGEPLAIFGSFFMNDQREVSEALDRYQKGDMGRLPRLRT